MIKPGSEFGYRLMKPFVLLKFKLKYHPKVYGRENIPLDGAFIICGNHIHKDDQYNVMMVTNRVIHYMAKEEYFDNKKTAWFYRFAGCIRVDRSIHDENAKSEAISILKSGKALGIFPEGTRNKTIGTKDEVKLLDFKYGAVSLAKKMNVPIIPFGISGRYDGSGITTHIGKALYVNDMELSEANTLLRNKILELMEK